MLFNALFDNPKKQHKLDELNAEIISLFDRYKIAWNEFAIKIGLEFNIPQLTKSASVNTIEECLNEIKSVNEVLDLTLNNLIEKLDLKSFNNTHYNQLEEVPSSLLKVIFNTLPHVLSLSVGSYTGLQIGLLVFKSYCPYAVALASLDDKLAALTPSLSQDINMIDAINNVYKQVSSTYVEYLGDLYAKYGIGLANVNNNNIALLQEELYNKINNKLIDTNIQFGQYIRELHEKNEHIINSLKPVEQPSFITEEIFYELKQLNINSRSVIDFSFVKVNSLDNGQPINLVFKIIDNGSLSEITVGEPPYLYETIYNARSKSFFPLEHKVIISDYLQELKLAKDTFSLINQLTDSKESMLHVAENEARSISKEIVKNNSFAKSCKFWTYSSISGVAITLLIETLSDIVIEWYTSNQLEKKLIEITQLLYELTEVIETQIENLSQFNQSVTDGVFIFDENHIFIIKDCVEPYILDIRNI